MWPGLDGDTFCMFFKTCVNFHIKWNTIYKL